MPRSRTLLELAASVGASIFGDANVVIDDVTHDSRQARPNSLFVAISGMAQNGHDFVAEAVSAGAAAVAVERHIEVEVPQMRLDSSRARLPRLAARVHGEPSRRLRVVGVTGTNGKTTACAFLESIAGSSSGFIGTTGAHIGGREVPLSRTTPEASDLQRLLRIMVEESVDVVALEVSSHALALGRIDETEFVVGAFTNLSQDHLDFHGDMESYFAVKAELFSRVPKGVVVVDDPWGSRLASVATVPVLTVGSGADVDADVHSAGVGGTDLTLKTPAGSRQVTLRIGGHFNVVNALVAAACALELGFDLDTIAHGLEAVQRVPGRFEVVPGDERFSVVVDYAHTPESVGGAVKAARDLGARRVLVVVGAGGDRDRSKRAPMGKAAAKADFVFLTSDNPRSEDPEAILADLSAGAGAGTGVVSVEVDRRAAIEGAIAQAGEGDIVLVLGKGHEQGQSVGGGIVPFDDRAVVKELLDRPKASS